MSLLPCRIHQDRAHDQGSTDAIRGHHHLLMLTASLGAHGWQWVCLCAEPVADRRGVNGKLPFSACTRRMCRLYNR